MSTSATRDPNRNPDGTFKAGNKAAKGNKGGRKHNKFAEQAEACTTVEEFSQVWDVIKRGAIEGGYQQQKLFLQYLVGRPVQRVVEAEDGDSKLTQLLDQVRAEMTGGDAEDTGG